MRVDSIPCDRCKFTTARTRATGTETMFSTRKEWSLGINDYDLCLNCVVEVKGKLDTALWRFIFVKPKAANEPA